jgi:hypothetical protein
MAVIGARQMQRELGSERGGGLRAGPEVLNDFYDGRSPLPSNLCWSARVRVVMEPFEPVLAVLQMIGEGWRVRARPEKRRIHGNG